jgi:hypothetical protein
MYALAAFTSAIILHAIAMQRPTVYAEDNRTANDYAMQSKIDINNNLVNQVDAKVDGNSHRLELLEARINALSDRQSMMEGAASSALGVLGVLQIFGLITSAKAKKEGALS